MNRLSIRRLALPPLMRGVFVVIISVAVATCRLGDLFTAPSAGELVAGGTLDRSAQVGSKAIVLGKIPVGNTGTSSLTWSAKVLGSTSTWLSVQNPTGSSKVDSVHVLLDPAGLDTGTYTDSISITSDVGAATVNVVWRIVPCIDKPIQPTGQQLADTLTLADCGKGHHANTQVQFYSFIGNQGDVVTFLLSSSSFNGFLALDTVKNPAVASLVTKTDCLGDTKNPCIYYFTLPSPATYYIEVSGATAADTGKFAIRLIPGNGRDPNSVQSLEQRLLPDSTKVVPINGPVGGAFVLVHGVVSDSDVVDSLVLEAEWQPVDTPFTGQVKGTSQKFAPNGTVASVLLGPLSDNKAYHWQVRARDEKNNLSTQSTHWDSLPNGGLPDFTVQIGHNPDPPNTGQYQSDGVTPIPSGGTLNGTTIVWKSTVTDPDGGTVQLRVEAQQLGTPFTNNPTAPSPFVPSGQVATATQPTLTDGATYHWQSQTFDGVRQSAWQPGSTFTVSQAPAQLVFIQQPTNATAGVAIAPAIKVQAQDLQGNPITTFAGTVTLQISNNAGGGTLSGAPPMTAVAGTATFSTASIDKAGVGYTLVASTTVNSTVISRISSAFNIVPGAISQLAYQVQPPPSTPATSVMTPAIKVAAQDQFQNVVTSFVGNMQIAIGTNPSGGTLSGTTTVAAVSGAATFATLSINNPGANYTLRTTIPSLPAVPGVVSQTFTITNAPGVHLVFTTNPPATTSAGVVMTPAIQVTARDDLGFTIPGFVTPVTVAFGNNPGGGTLGGTLTVTPVSGVATFSDLTINKVGTSYTLVATATGATTGASNPFNITFGPLSQLVFTGQPPATTTAGVAITPAVQVTGEDQFGNVVTNFTGSVTMGFATNPAGGTFTPTSTTSVAAVSGTATFSNLHIRTAGSGYSLQASTLGIPPSPASNAFTITPAPAASLAFTNQPGNPTTAGVVINVGSGGVVVTARDSVGNVATGFTSNVTMIASGGNPLIGTTTVPATSGTAIFNNLRIRTPVGAYTLQASSGLLTSPPSSLFNIITGPANRDTFIVQPVTTAVQARIDSAQGGLVVWIVDSVGNLVTTATNTVTVQLSSNPTGAILGGSNSFPASGGIATFANLTVSKIGTYTLAATTPSLINDISSSFTVVPGPAKSLVFKTQPPISPVANTPFGATVAALDVAGDTAIGFTGTVTMALNPSSGTLGGTVSVAAAAGIATFSNLTVAVASPPSYTLTASTPALPSGPVTSVTSSSFTVQPGGVSIAQSQISTSTPTMTACKNPGCTPNTTAATITVTALDAGNNPVPGQTVTLSTNGNGDAITQPASVTDANGKATGTITDTTVELLTVHASIGSAGLINNTTSVSVTAGAPAVLVWLSAGQPRDTTAGAALKAPGGLQVRVQDQFHNNVPSATNSVLISILIPPSPNNGAVLSGSPNPKAASGGIATFTNLSINIAGSGYALLASSNSPTVLTPDTSSPFNILSGVATQLSIATQPSTIAQSGVAIPTQPAVQLLDALNNPVNQSGVLVTAALATGSGSLTNATASTNGSGLATFSGLAINGVVGSYSLKFTTTSPSLTSSNSNSISLSAGTATKLGFFTQPTNTTGGTAIPTTVQVEIEDASGNRVTSASATIAMALGTNPKNGHLTGTTSVGTSSGVASFSNLVIDSAATGYTLSATGGFTGATSNTFNVTVGSATNLGFRIQPANTGGGSTMATVEVEIRDAGGNRVTTGSRNISLAISTNPNNGTLSGTFTNVASAAGLADFSTLSIDSAGTGYVFQATAAGGPALTGAFSSSFNIIVGPAAQLIYFVQPASPQTSGMTVTPPVQVEVADLGGNRVTSSTATIAIDFGTNPGGNLLGGTLSKPAVAGLVSFDDLVITGAGSGYTLVATSSGLTGTGPSNPFTVN